MGNGDTYEVDHEQESIDDAEELEGGTVKVCQKNGETEGKNQADDQGHEGQSLAELMGGFPSDLLQRTGIAVGSLESSCLQGGLTSSPVP